MYIGCDSNCGFVKYTDRLQVLEIAALRHMAYIELVECHLVGHRCPSLFCLRFARRRCQFIWRTIRLS